ncbi:acyltransferase family protein [Lutimonas zeaxanthinifaciens]|uniref:acyltransferase family protein n=1 Tax=Lutimonas zeaxanthinifaciens TaxID=3060215 RepID=UPI00265D4D95|nr:acyltransferase [Lutimonas sp. YSD2104]WKK66838.1 acyltransferase [Lutimonas sp. YSD2104]
MIKSIVYLRAIASILVLISHSAHKASQYSTNPMYWYKVKGIGVDLFFIVSGFILCYITYDKVKNPFHFLRARILRIMPLYWVLTIFALVIYFILPDKVNSSGGETNIYASFFILPTKDNLLITNGWTLRYTVLFYVIYSIGLFFSIKNRNLIIALILIILFSSGLFLNPKNIYLNYITSGYLFEFFLGILIFYIHKNIKMGQTYGLILIFLSGAIVVFLKQMEISSGYRIIDNGITSFFFFLGMLAVEPFFQKHKNSQISKLMTEIGNSSYSLYLFHPFILVLTSLILQKFHLTNFGYFFILNLMLSSIIGGYICYFFIEKPLIKFTKAKLNSGNNTNKLKRFQINNVT